MKRLLATLALSGAVALPVFAAESSDLSCSDYMAMDTADRMKAVEQMEASETPMAAAEPESATGGGEQISTEDLAAGSGTSSGTLGADMMVANAEKACSAHSDGTVSEALEMMADG